MAISRARKEALVAEYTEQLEQSQGLVLAHYSALTVAQMQALRGQTREQDGKVYVVKNTLLRDVLREKQIEFPEDLLTGPTLVAFCHQDAPPVAKVFKTFAKESEQDRFVLRGAVVEGKFYDGEQTKQLAELPSREVVLGQLLGTINAPATQMAGVVASGIRQIVNLVKAYADKLEEGGVPAEAAA